MFLWFNCDFFIFYYNNKTSKSYFLKANIYFYFLYWLDLLLAQSINKKKKNRVSVKSNLMFVFSIMRWIQNVNSVRLYKYIIILCAYIVIGWWKTIGYWYRGHLVSHNGRVATRELFLLAAVVFFFTSSLPDNGCAYDITNINNNLLYYIVPIIQHMRHA